MNEDHFTEKLNKKLPSDELKLDMIATLMGCSGVMLEYFALNGSDIKKWPDTIKYAASIIAGNLRSLISDDETPSSKNFAERSPYKMSEQTQERIDRTAKELIKEIYEATFAEDEGV